MSLAYHILAHKNPGQVARLLKALQHPDDVFVLHFDKRSPKALHMLGNALASEHNNVVLQRPRHIIWGGSQIPDVQIEAMGIALARSGRWTHFINISGQDFPLRPRSAIIDRLGANASANFVTWFDPFERRLWNDVKERLERRHLHWQWLHTFLDLSGMGRLRRLAGYSNGTSRIPYIPGYRRQPPGFFQYFGGSNHAILSRAGCTYLIHDPRAIRIRRWLAATAIPDESVFQSVLLNSKLANTVVSRNFRTVDFPAGSAHPRIFRETDFDFLASSPNFFARKFDTSVDPVILDMIETKLLNPASTPC